MRKRVVYLLFLLAAVALLTACGDERIDAGDGGDPGDGGDGEPDIAFEGFNVDGVDLNGEWIMTAGSVDGAELVPVPGYEVTVDFDGAKIGGTAACNGYGGSFTVGDDLSFAVTDLASTEMACIDDGVMELEAAFLQALARSDRIAAVDGSLVLNGDGVELVVNPIAPVEAADLVGTEWVLDSMIYGDAVSSTVAGAPAATLLLNDDGSFRAVTGCRVLEGGDFDVAADRLTIRLGDFESQGCDAEGSAEEQDEAMLAVFGQADIAYSIDSGRNSDRLTLLAPDGDGLSFTSPRS